MEIKHSYDNKKELLILDFEDQTKIEIITKGDIDFTELVKVLTLKLETKNKMILSEGDYEDSKLKTVFNTIRTIIDSYNTVLLDYFDVS